MCCAMQSIPDLFLGTWKLKHHPGTITKAWDLGYRAFDTASMYKTESEIGRLIENNDKQPIFIISKLWNTSNTLAKITSELDQTLNNLCIDQLDLWLMHNPCDTERETVDKWRIMCGVANECGKVRHLGVSNFGVVELQWLTNDPSVPNPVANQIEMNVMCQQPGVVDFCRRHNITVIGHTPFKFMQKYGIPPVLAELSIKYGVSEHRIALEWYQAKGVSVCVMSTNPKHLHDNLLAIQNDDKSVLTPDDIKLIDSLDQDKPTFRSLDK